MRVAYVVSRFPSTTETFIAREMLALSALGVDVSLFALVHQPDAVVHAEAAPFLDRLHTTGAFSWRVASAQVYWLRRRPRAYLRAWKDAIVGNIRDPAFLLRAIVVLPTAAWFACVVQSEPVDRVHAHWATHSALAAWVMHRLTGLPYSITAHAHDIFVDRSMLAQKLEEADFVAVISEFNRRFLTVEYGPGVAEKLHVVRCGVESPPAQPMIAPGARLRILCVASLQDYKGHHVLLDAVAVLAARGVDVDVRLVGDGPLRERLTDLARARNIDDRVEFLGSRTSDQVAQLLRESDLMVLSSVVTASGKMEGIPVALMEALAAGVPAVASAISGIPELVRDEETGLLVQPGDPVDLADAIERFVDEPQLAAKLGAQGRSLVRTEFDLAINAQRLYELFVR